MGNTKVTNKNSRSSNHTSKQSSNRLTLLAVIESVVEGARDSQFSDMFFFDRREELKFLADSYGITPRQAAIFCVCRDCRKLPKQA